MCGHPRPTLQVADSRKDKIHQTAIRLQMKRVYEVFVTKKKYETGIPPQLMSKDITIRFTNAQTTCQLNYNIIIAHSDLPGLL